jgi:protein O-mannosyl-transferase
MKFSGSIRQERRSSRASERRPRGLSARAALVLALCLAVSAFAVYSPSLKFQFILDDHRFTSDPRIQEAGHLWDYFANYVWAQFTGGPPSFYRPMFLVWMRLNFLINELSPWGWHLLSIAKHLSVGLLLGMLAWKLLRDPVAALVAATLFVLHPAQTESVSWVTVPDPLMSAAVLGALLLYLRYVEGRSLGAQPKRHRSGKTSASSATQRSPVLLLASAAIYFLALLAKETAIIFPAVILGLGLLVEEQQAASKNRAKITHQSIRTRLTRVLLQLSPCVGATVVYLVLRLHALHGKLGAVTQHLPWRTVILSWPATLWFYVKVLLWPVRSYSFADPALSETFSVRGVLVPLLALACAGSILAGALYWGWRRARRDLSEHDAAGSHSALLAGTLLMVLPLVLTLNLNALNPGDFLHGRYTYLPLAGLMLLVATLWRMSAKLQVPSLFAFGAVTIMFAGLTLFQEEQWKDDSTVFTIAHQLAPRNGPVAHNLANTHVQAALRLGEEGRCSEAIPIFQQVIQNYPQDWFAWAGVGDCFVQLNDLAKAEESLHRAAELSHDARVVQHWQEVRAHMGLSSSVQAN